MTAQTATIADFLLARIDADEAAARAAEASDAWGNPYSDGTDLDYTFTPARVLAECEAKRRIVEAHRRADESSAYCAECDTHREWPCPTLRLLAQPYADHSDWREEWRA